MSKKKKRADSSSGSRENTKNSAQQRKKDMVEMLIYIVVVFALVFLITRYVGQRTVVHGVSMDTTLADGQSLIMDKISYRFSDPERYDIVIFPGPEDETGNSEYYIKRIIGLPGETVEFKDDRVVINGKELTTDVYSITGYTEDYGDMDYPLTLGEGEYFCMGDNRPQSFDCRYSEVGTVHKNEFIGKVWIRIWPLSKFGKVD